MLKKVIDCWPFGKDKDSIHSSQMIKKQTILMLKVESIMEILKVFGHLLVSHIQLVKQLVGYNIKVLIHNLQH